MTAHALKFLAEKPFGSLDGLRAISDDQDRGKTSRGRKLSDGGARARFYHEVAPAHLTRIVRVDLKSESFTYAIDDRALAHARLMDGKLLLVTNAVDLTPEDVIKRYKSLADIERVRISAHRGRCFSLIVDDGGGAQVIF